jgi:hypothetical protein
MLLEGKELPHIQNHGFPVPLVGTRGFTREPPALSVAGNNEHKQTSRRILHPPAFDTQRPIGTRCVERLGRDPKPTHPPAPSTAANRDTLCWRLRRAHVGMFLPTLFGRQFLPGSFCRHFGRHFRSQGPQGARGKFCERFAPLKGAACRPTIPTPYALHLPTPTIPSPFVGRPCSEAPLRENLSFLGLAQRRAMGGIWGLFGG